jgi:DNA-binding MarR family transcriptional regulator
MSPEPTLYIEGLKMRPSAEKVLHALFRLDGRPDIFQAGNTVSEIAQYAGLSCHVVRARLQDLRRLGLIESEGCPQHATCGDLKRRYAHYLTTEGDRRAMQ